MRNRHLFLSIVLIMIISGCITQGIPRPNIDFYGGKFISPVFTEGNETKITFLILEYYDWDDCKTVARNQTVNLSTSSNIIEQIETSKYYYVKVSWDFKVWNYKILNLTSNKEVLVSWLNC